MNKKEREELIELLRSKGIKDESVLKAMLGVERHKFVPAAVKQHSYQDIALPIGYGQTISQPYTVAFMTEALQLKPNSKVLEIGTGSGYQAAILYKMGVKVYTIERNQDIYNMVLKLFDDLGIRAAVKCGDGTIGWEEFSPYDGIIVTAGSPTIPENLKKQLKVSGRLVIPVGNRYSQIMKILTKISDDKFDINSVPSFAFVPLVGREGWKEE
ncbi:MAG: protein-L-isoaspartate O-methyltransferase [Ignavibacteria bacterium RBG_13_36_8]|nr:MAG: protein-L-isoaspartate O-methyltransferase [Ignavibacteria bacterium RBG_13_36_8]